jgi:hypothetical protein
MKLLPCLLLVFSLSNSIGSGLALGGREGTSPQTCPVDLSSLRPQMETALVSVSSPGFKKAILASLLASIPDAIRRADGIDAPISYLKREIVEQEHVQRYSEKVARDANGHFREPLKPCHMNEKGSYCTAVEQYYISAAANLANRAFLDALMCYKRQGMR